MEKILQSYIDLREKSKNYGDDLVAIKPNIENVFAMIFNNATVVLEVLDNYDRYWKRKYVGIPQQKIDELKEQNAERVMEITKWSFTHALSSLEYSAKKIIKNISQIEFQDLKNKLQRGKWVYLSGIMEISKTSGLITKEDYDRLEGITYLRNCLVHNNGIADKDKTFTIRTVNIKCENGKMIQGKLDIFYNLTDVSVDLYNDWLHKI